VVIPGSDTAVPEAVEAAPAAAAREAATDSLFWRRVAGTAGSRAYLLVLGMVSAILTARVLGPGGRGLLAALVTLGAVGVQLGQVGMPAALTFHAAGRQPVRRLLGVALMTALGWGTALAVAALVVFAVVPSIAPVDRFTVLALGLAWIPLGLLLQLGQSLLLGTGDVRRYNLTQVAEYSGAVLLMVALWQAGRASPVSFYLAGFASMVAVGAYTTGRIWRVGGPPSRPPASLLRAMAGYGGKAFLSSMFAFLVLQFDLLMVIAMLGDAAAGQYSIAARMAEMIYLVPVSVGTILFATVASMEDGRWRFTRGVTLRLAAVLVPGLALAAVLARPVIVLLFGEAFLPAAGPFLWLLPGILLLSLNTQLMNYFAGIGMPLVTVLAPAAAFILNVGLNAWLLPSMGIVGAALASTASYTLMFAGSVAYILAVRRS